MDFLDPADATTPEQQAALAQALRRQQSLGILAQLSGDKVLAPVGSSILESADRGQQRADIAKQRRLQLSLDAKKDLETRDYQQQELGLRGQELKIAQQRAGADAFVPTPAQDETGATKLLSFSKRTGKYLNPDGSVAEGAKPIPKVGAGGAGSLSQDKFKNQLLGKLGDELDPYKGRANLTADGQRAIQAAERVETLANSPGPMTPQRVEELTMMAATVAAGGKQPTESQVHAMLPKTFRGDVAQWVQYATANPQDAGVQEFVKQTMQQSEREKATAAAQMKRAFVSKLTHHSTAFEKYPEEAHRIAEEAGLKGLYDPKTLRALQEIDPVKEAGKLNDADKPARKAARIQELIKGGERDAKKIHDTLKSEGLL